ncbi:protein phosphatase 2C domain-containing protein [Terrilactibacillus laevilacticus]|uniref:Protein phosphatase 2C domain-containing protein n=1 Tax=Terrilactibacillus laevilacticus TaxID=1380157 RepID=A0ABW5PR58_9BACI|nr:protein phosphatase 2C domain-containing protein [Terrilactibacillus laevilacticus]
MIERFPLENFGVLALQKSKHNNPFCGDSYYIKETDHFLLCVLADGLGSGQGANEAAERVTNTAKKLYDQPIDLIMERINDALVNYRGAVVSIFKILFKEKKVSYCGIGNIKLSIHPIEGKPIIPIPQQGFLTGRPIHCQVQTFVYPSLALFVMHSDGVVFRSNRVSDIKSLYRMLIEEEVERSFETFSERYDDDMTLLIGRPKEAKATI